MTREDSIRQIENYSPFNEQEEKVSVKEDENSGVAWFSPNEALEKSTEPWFVERVYSKLVEKMRMV